MLREGRRTCGTVSERDLRSRKVAPASNERVRVGAIRPVKSIPATRVLPALTSSVPPAGSLAALQSPSGERGASVPPGAVVLPVDCVFRPEIGTWHHPSHPTKGQPLAIILHFHSRTN